MSFNFENGREWKGIECKFQDHEVKSSFFIGLTDYE